MWKFIKGVLISVILELLTFSPLSGYTCGTDISSLTLPVRVISEISHLIGQRLMDYMLSVKPPYKKKN